MKIQMILLTLLPAGCARSCAACAAVSAAGQTASEALAAASLNVSASQQRDRR